jgi:hypothetical protein
MRSRTKKIKKDKLPYVTKRILVSASSSAIREAAEVAMKIAGYIVKAENGWVIKEYKDGTREKISKLDHKAKPAHRIVLD